MTLIYVDSFDRTLTDSFDGITNGSVTFVDTSAGEDLHHLDISMDRQKPHWTWLNEHLSLFRSAMLFSNGQFKIITDRNDLPTRMVFNQGNMVPQSWNLNISRDSLQPNQCVVEFPNRELDYERDVLYLQNSATAASLVPIKPFNMDLPGITRRSEAMRLASLEMQRRNSKIRSAGLETDLAAVPLEPGDVVAVHVPLTNFDMGIGGKLVDGSTAHAVLDRPFEIQSGNTYEMYVWHTAGDTLEKTTLLSSPPGITITVTPVGGFSFAAVAGETYAIGVASRDVLLMRTLSVERLEKGTHRVKASEYLKLQWTLDCPGTPSTAYVTERASQPTSVSVTVNGCIVTVGSFVYVSPQSGQFTNTGSGRYVWTSTHNPNLSAHVGDSLSITTGVASGFKTYISSWYPSSGPIAFLANTPVNGSGSPTNPANGDRYIISLNGSVTGFQLRTSTNGTSFTGLTRVYSTTGTVNVTDFGAAQQIMVVPVNSRGYINDLGSWVISLATPNCAEFESVTQAATVVGAALTYFAAVTIPGSTLGSRNRLDAEIQGLLSENCGGGANTSVTFSMIYGNSASVVLPAVSLNAGGGAAITDGGARIRAKIFATASNRQSLFLEYDGVTVGNGYVDVGGQGNGITDSTLPQTLAFGAQFSFTVNSCFSFGFQSMVTEVTSL